MTPEAIRFVSQLRADFYSLFATVMAVPVNLIKDDSSASERFLAFWLDERLKLNYVLIYAHTRTKPSSLDFACNFNGGIPLFH